MRCERLPGRTSGQAEPLRWPSLRASGRCLWNLRLRPPAVAKPIASAVQSSRSEGTRKTYAAAWRRFTSWCTSNGHVTLPAHPITVAAYLIDAADTRTEAGERAYAVATFGTWIAAINHRHGTTGHLSPSAHEIVAATLSGIRREYGAEAMPRLGRRGPGAPQFGDPAARIRRRIPSQRTRSSCAGTLPCIGMTDSTSG